MLRNLLIVLVVSSIFLSCQSKTALNYSENFVKKEKSLTADITDAETRVAAFANSAQFDSIGVVGAQMEKKVDAKLKEIQDEPAPDVKEGENFKAAGIRYFQFIKSLYSGYKDYGYAKTEEERAAHLAKIQEIAGKKNLAISDIQSAQKKYAEANGFKIEKTY